MPVAQSRGHAGKALLVAGVGVVLALGIAFLVAQMASRGDVEIRLGDDRFEVGKAERLARAIEREEGLPVLVPDLVGRQRNLYVQHLGDDADEGWVAFGAFDPEDPACAVQIDREAQVLVNDCDESDTYPLDGTGLRFYPTVVEDGEVIVDLNELSTTTTAADGG